MIKTVKKNLNKSPHIHTVTHTKHTQPLKYPIQMFDTNTSMTRQ